MDTWREFPGPNAAYVLDLYERYRHDPSSVDAPTREFFKDWTPQDAGAGLPTESEPFHPPIAPLAGVGKIVAAVNLAQAIRAYGHRAARLDPLGSEPRFGERPSTPSHVTSASVSSGSTRSRTPAATRALPSR